MSCIHHLICEHLETKTTSVDVPFQSVDVIVDIAVKVALRNVRIGVSINGNQGNVNRLKQQS